MRGAATTQFGVNCLTGRCGDPWQMASIPKALPRPVTHQPCARFNATVGFSMLHTHEPRNWLKIGATHQRFDVIMVKWLRLRHSPSE